MLPMYNVHLYFSLKNLGKKVYIIYIKILYQHCWHVLEMVLVSEIGTWTPGQNLLINLPRDLLWDGVYFLLSLNLYWGSYGKKSELASLWMRNHMERYAQPTASTNCQICDQSYLKSSSSKLTCQKMDTTSDLRQNQ